MKVKLTEEQRIFQDEIISMELFREGSEWRLYLCYFDKEREYLFDSYDELLDSLSTLKPLYH